MSHKLFCGVLTSCALVATSLTGVASSQTAPLPNPSAVAVIGATISFGSSIGGNYTGSVNTALSSNPSTSTAGTNTLSTTSPSFVSTNLNANANNGVLSAAGNAGSAVLVSPAGAGATAGASAGNTGAAGTTVTNNITGINSAPGLSSGSAAGSFGSIGVNFY
jgi:hypothetical protein